MRPCSTDASYDKSPLPSIQSLAVQVMLQSPVSYATASPTSKVADLPAGIGAHAKQTGCLGMTPQPCLQVSYNARQCCNIGTAPPSDASAKQHQYQVDLGCVLNPDTRSRAYHFISRSTSRFDAKSDFTNPLKPLHCRHE